MLSDGLNTKHWPPIRKDSGSIPRRREYFRSRVGIPTLCKSTGGEGEDKHLLQFSIVAITVAALCGRDLSAWFCSTGTMVLAYARKSPVVGAFALLIICNIIIIVSYNRNNCSLLMKVIEERDGKIQQLTDELSCQRNGVLPNGGFCMDQNNKMVGYPDIYDSKLCEGLEKLFGYSSVGDLGSSRGLFGSCFLRLNNSIITMKGKEDSKKLQESYLLELNKTNLLSKPQVIRSWQGFEAAYGVEEESKGLIHRADLSKPLDKKYQFDWVMSLEVGEHIPEEGEQKFLDNLVNHACKGVVVSWALPGQGGYHHVNLRPNEYIIKEMEKRGMKHDPEAQKALRDVSYYYWYKNTVMVFRFPQKTC